MRDRCNCVWPMFLDSDAPIIVAICRPGYFLADSNEITKLRYYAPGNVKTELARGGCANVEECETAANGADCIVKCEEEEKEVTIEFMTLRELTEESLRSLSRHIKKGADILVVYHPFAGPSTLRSLRSSIRTTEIEVVVKDIKDLLNVCYSNYRKGTIMLVPRPIGRVIESGGKKFSILALR